MTHLLHDPETKCSESSLVCLELRMNAFMVLVNTISNSTKVSISLSLSTDAKNCSLFICHKYDHI